jgi:YVTN family beta-propeller protein
MTTKKSSIQSPQQIALLTTLLICAFALVLSTHPLYAATSSTQRAFHIENEWNLGGIGGWGYLSLDNTAHRLYIPRTSHVMVVDTQTGKVFGEIEGLKNTRGIVLDDSGKYGYVTDPTDGTAGFVRVFDRSTLKLITSVPTGLVPATIIFDPITKHVIAFNSHSHSATVIDSTTNQVVATIPLHGRPTTAVVDGSGHIFVDLPALGEITRIDTTGAAANTVTASWQLAPCTGPSGLAIDAKRGQLYTTCEDHKLVTVDADSGHVTAIGDAPAAPGDMQFDPQQDLLFIADAAGKLAIFHRESNTHYSQLQPVQTQPGARVMIFSSQQDRVYLVTSKFGKNTATASEELQFRTTPVPGTFSVIVVGH